ncbi:MAG: SDR family NAD(P)-dependent oxidoreductase [Pseudobdellovibrio sp.]
MNSRLFFDLKIKEISAEDRIAILGASRGLGWALYQELLSIQKNACFFLSSRKIDQRQSELSKSTIFKVQDFSKTPIEDSFLQDLQKFAPTRLIYMAGGGPFGEFHKKKWADHLWALNTTFLFPAELLHRIISSPEQWFSLQQIVFVGSEVAESKPDPSAASYAAAKHALKGLISTVQSESLQTPEIILFSPGYMQTEMLPQNSPPRLSGLAQTVDLVAKKLIAIIEKNNQR